MYTHTVQIVDQKKTTFFWLSRVKDKRVMVPTRARRNKSSVKGRIFLYSFNFEILFSL